MSASDRTPATETSHNIDYTVRQTAKIHREKQQDPRSSVWFSVAKCVFGIFLFASVLTCLVASKISLLSMASFRDKNATNIQKKDPKQNQETLFIMTVLVLMIPEGFTFLRACWTSLFSKSRKWPCKKAIIVGVVSGLFEVFGLCFFTVIILMETDIPPGLRIIMMNGVFVFPILWQAYKRRPRGQDPYSWKQFLAFTLALILEIVGVGVLMYLFHDKDGNIVVWVTTGIPLALLGISFAWCPMIFKIAIEPTTDQPPPDLNQSMNGSVRVEISGVPVTLPEGQTILGVATSSKSARGKAAVITSLWKLFLIPFAAALFCHLYNTADLNNLRQGFSDFSVKHSAFPYFMVQIFTSLVGYMLGILACSMCMQFLAFAFPMALATPITVALAMIKRDDDDVLHFHYHSGEANEILLYVIVGCFWIAQFLSVGYYLVKGQDFIMAKESSLFWMPTYNGVLLEQHLLLNRRNKITDDYQINHRELVDNSCVYICTTMYHEIEQEMEQLLQSLHDIDCAREKSRRQIESHIFFDGAIKGDVLNNYVLQLISLIPKTLKVKIENCMKLKTPYGMQMRWRLPGGMFFHIHLKDNLRVKNKKRWSQVMYMSYVLDFKEKQMEVTDENTYILTTDADVRFTHESVEALLDLMARDPTVGAVCGRTHPLGVGPIVWYQVFDYAIGHWFQKVANHVLGSVMCSPGCFSVYRAAALRDVLPIYSSKVDSSFDFLTKDMGEDRWLCTLMVQSGWRLEYCAAAEDSTYCPDNFDEFFKQRRRWIPSTLANLLLVISEWKLTVNNNDYISFGFIFYQALMVFSTVISPSTVILIIASGLSYVHFIESATVLVVLLSLLTLGYGLICLYTSQEFQLKAAKLLTVVFSLLMAFVTVGVAAQAADDIYKRQHPPTPTPTTVLQTTPRNITPSLSVTSATTLVSTTAAVGDELPANVSSLYLGGLIGIFLLAALLHPTEAFCLLNGIWYLLCLPSGYLLLIVYSICNMTDRSWGTREEKTKKVDDVPWYETLWTKIRYMCTCCRPEPTPQRSDTSRVEGHVTDSASVTSGEENSSSDGGLQASEDEGTVSVQEDDPGKESDADSFGPTDRTTKLLDEAPPKSALKHTPLRRQHSHEGQKEDSGRFMKFRYPGDRKVTFATKLPRLHPETPVEDWLQRDFQQLYLNNFKDCGYDNVSFIAGMTDKHLKAIGIEKRGHRKRLLIDIEKLPQVEIPQEVPENVEDWLTELGLDEYWENFTQSGYTEPRMLEDLKLMNKEELKETFRIIKPGHLDKMYKAIQKVQYPSEAQRRIRRAREETNKLLVMDLKVDNQDLGLEYHFWEGLRQACLVPESAVFGAVEELKEKLEDLRDMTLMVFAVANAIWIILIMALISQKNLQVMGTNFLGFAFLCVYGFLIVIQFLTLLWHRGVTFCHVIARAPWRRGKLHRVWAFDDQNLPPPPDERALEDVRNQRRRRPRRKQKNELRRVLSQPSGPSEERETLLADERPQSSYGSRSVSKLI